MSFVRSSFLFGSGAGAGAVAGAGAGLGAGAGAVAGTGAVAEPFAFFRSSFVFGSGLSASSPDVPVQGVCLHPPGCSSPGGGVSCLRGPPDVLFQGPPSWFLATPRMFQSRAVGWPPGCSSPVGSAAILLLGLLRSADPPDAPVQGAVFLLLGHAPDVPVQGRCGSSCGPLSFGPQPPGCSTLGGNSSSLREAVAGAEDSLDAGE